jgi:general secretion pathway protein G
MDAPRDDRGRGVPAGAAPGGPPPLPLAGPAPPPNRGWAVTAMVLGICGVIPVVGVLACLAAIPVSLTVLIGRKEGRGMAVAGLVCSLVFLAGYATISLAGVYWFRARKVAARATVAQLHLQQIETALACYQMDMGRYPTREEGGLQALVTPPKPASGRAARRWAGPYLQQAAVDPWGNPLNYEPVETGGEDAAGRSYRLWSNGPDGRDDDGGNDDILSGANRPTGPGS